MVHYTDKDNKKEKAERKRHTEIERKRNRMVHTDKDKKKEKAD